MKTENIFLLHTPEQLVNQIDTILTMKTYKEIQKKCISACKRKFQLENIAQKLETFMQYALIMKSVLIFPRLFTKVPVFPDLMKGY
jgi:hypothetical protein